MTWDWLVLMVMVWETVSVMLETVGHWSGEETGALETLILESLLEMVMKEQVMMLVMTWV